ncbi:MAG: response regulator transcription factor [Prevotella sp.]|jgi:DNA-binding LytR/AlgR family response regulator|nr:response regulator transcription factor [Prevotella sp.]MBR2206163.1 response regulator transcription factor [Prevotella sp.]MBR2230017.1 response regulator transcription factor [Prevotella sp.]MBR3110555.1 response regulator transcription factor [Prevotella sp.]
MTISCAIIDDEPLAAGLLESYARKTPYLQLVGTYNSAILAMKDLRDNPVQLLFLDIQMPELSGVEFAKILPKDTRVIFTTAFPQYAVEGYKVNALDYLLKPISYEDFLKSTDKALEWFSIIQRQDAYRRDRFMFVKTDYKLQRVNLDDILFIEGLKDYVRFYLKDGEKVMSLMSMKKLEEYLPRPEFLRTHRSYIVHMTETPLVDRFRIVFGENYIPVSENYKDDVQNYFDIHTLV